MTVNKIRFFIFLLMFSCTLIRGDTKRTYLISLNMGENNIERNSDIKYNVGYLSLNFYPQYHRSGFGLNAGLADQANGGEFKYLQTKYFLQGSYFGIVPGLILKFGEMGEIFEQYHFLLPSLRIKVGDLKKVFLSIDCLHDLYLGVLSIHMHYILSNNFSKISLGFISHDQTLSEYSGLTLNGQILFHQNLYLGLRSNIQIPELLVGFQVMLGWELSK